MLAFAFDYPPLDGGLARLCGEIVAGLAKNQQIHVLSERRDMADSIVPAGPDIQETRVTGRRPLREVAAWWHVLLHRRTSTVIAGTWYPEALIATLAGCRDVVILAHGAELTAPLNRWRRPLWTWLRRFTLQHAQLVVANSRYTAGMVSRDAPGAKVVAIPLAVDHDRFQPGDTVSAREMFGVRPGNVVIATVTRIQAFKGVDVVLRAIAALPIDQRMNLTYLVAGKGPALDELKSLAEDLGVSEHVRWLGFVAEGDLPNLYRAADLFALCTRELLDQRSVEGFGMVFLEAQASGTPVVGTRTGGIPDAIKVGEGGWLIEQDDVPALTKLLASLCDDPGGYRDAGLAARSRVERECTWDHYMEQFRKAIAHD